MIKASLFVLLTTLTVSASAQWTELSQLENGSTFYIDLSTLKKQSHNRTFWRLSNYSQPDSRGNMSVLARININCANETSQYLAVRFFTQHYARGTPAAMFDNVEKAVNVSPRTVMDDFMKAVCNK